MDLGEPVRIHEVIIPEEAPAEEPERERAPEREREREPEEVPA